MVKITTGISPNARKTPLFITGIKPDTRKMAKITTGKCANAGVNDLGSQTGNKSEIAHPKRRSPLEYH